MHEEPGKFVVSLMNLALPHAARRTGMVMEFTDVHAPSVTRTPRINL